MVRYLLWSLVLFISAVAVSCGKLGYDSDDDTWELTADGGPASCDAGCTMCSNGSCALTCPPKDADTSAPDCGKRRR